MQRRLVFLVLVALVLPLAGPAAPLFAAARSTTPTATATVDAHAAGRAGLRAETRPPKGFIPAVVRQSAVRRYFVVMKAPGIAQRIAAAKQAGHAFSGAAQASAKSEVLASQRGALSEAKAAGGHVVFRYSTLINGFSTTLSVAAAKRLAARSDVASVQPVSIVKLDNSSSVPFIGAPTVWSKYGAKGQGMTLALVDTGIDYTHKDFGGSGDPADYANNDPNVIEPGTFPTKKVIGGYDFVGSNYDVLDDDPTNDIPRPDFDPLDRDGHGTHTGGTCCGVGVPGRVGAGVAPAVKILAYKVWDAGNSTDDVLVAAYERAVDPNQDGNTSDHADVLSFSGGVDYGTLNSVEATAAQRVVDVGTVFVASAGNAGNQANGGSAYIAGTPANARGVISVAASIDQFTATQLSIASSSSPLTLEDHGLMIHQSWSADLPTGPELTAPLFDGNAVDPVADPANPSPTDAQFCDPVAPGSLTGKTVVIYKGATGDGDCAGTQKVLNVQDAGATAVVLISLFTGAPFDLAPGAEVITIPVVMISGRDGADILDVLSPGGAFNTGAVSATFHVTPSAVPGYADSMTDFTSEGPARLTNDLKPDVSAPGFDIISAGVGTGTEGVSLSGTSMAAPHVSGAAILLRQLHPTWSPNQIKSLLMNHATPNMKNNDLSAPAPATVIGAGRIQVALSAAAKSLASPGSLSFGLRYFDRPTFVVKSFNLKNYDKITHAYRIDGSVRYNDFGDGVAMVAISLDGHSFASAKSFVLPKGKTKTVWVRLRIDPTVIGPSEALGWYHFHPNVDGTIRIRQTRGTSDTLRVPWHIAPLAAAKDTLSATTLDLSGGPATVSLTHSGAGTSHADLYMLGATDPVNSTGEEDIVAIGARSFTGNTIDGVAEGLPPDSDPLVGLSWLDFLTNADTPTEPIEFVVQGAAVRNTSETEEIDILVDSGADGVFADPVLQADYLIVKLPGASGDVVVYDLSVADPFETPVADYFPDYSVYNTNLTGLVVDAQAIGLSDGASSVSYQVLTCTGGFSGDPVSSICDTAGDFDPDSGTYTARLDAIAPALNVDPLVCGGFWGGPSCDAGAPIDVSVGSAAADETPSILAVFPNDPPSRNPTVIETTR